jgi:fluoroquinolone transport system permease protein
VRRTAALLACDVRLQARNGFYHAAAVVLLIWALLGWRLPALAWAELLPAVVLNNLAIGTFFFVGGLVLLERDEGTLEALVVTPVRTSEYLAARVATLSAVAVLENVLVVWWIGGPGFAAAPLVAGAALASVMFCLTGFIAVVRYRSVNEYLLPAMGYTVLLFLPVLPYFGVGAGPWVYAHPVQGPLLLLRGAFSPLTAGEAVYAVVYSLVWIVVLGVLARRAFIRFVVATAAREGG